jgi:hypothetical protein
MTRSTEGVNCPGLDQYSERVEVGAVGLGDERSEALAYEERQDHGAELAVDPAGRRLLEAQVPYATEARPLRVDVPMAGRE